MRVDHDRHGFAHLVCMGEYRLDMARMAAGVDDDKPVGRIENHGVAVRPDLEVHVARLEHVTRVAPGRAGHAGRQQG